MKQAIVAAVAVMVLMTHSLAHAQEREPLAMRIELEWTVAGTILGALIGAAVWLTDPGNPNIILGETVIEAAALGTIAGAGFGFYIMQQRVQLPAGFADRDAAQDGRMFPSARRQEALAGMPAPAARGIMIPLVQFKLRF